MELHDSVAQQMRYVSILAEKVSDKKLSKEIRENQSECIENIRNACYTLSSIDMDKGGFIEILRISVENFQKRTGISTSLVIIDDGNGVDEKILRAMNSKNVTSIKNQHFGLQNIKLRLNEIGGTIKYFSEKREGTEVRMRIGK